MAELRLDAKFRQLTGRKVKQLRREGLVPVVIYGREQEPENAQVGEAALERVLHGGGNSQLVRVNLDGEERNILIREVQRDPVRHNPLHADFYAINMREKQQVTIPIIGVGRPAGLNPELVLVQSLDQVEIEALPAAIPANVEVDVSSLESPDSPPITVSDLPAIEGVEYITDADESVFSLVYTRVAVEEEEEEELLVDMEAEPEVIGRGRDDEDEEDREE